MLEPLAFYEFTKAQLAKEDLHLKKIFVINDILKAKFNEKNVCLQSFKLLDEDFFNGVQN